MKKILSLFIAAAIFTAALTGCASKTRQTALDAIKDSYASSSYYDAEQKEVDAIVADYTKQIEEAKDDETINKLQAEAIEKITAIYTKDKIDGIKADGEEALKLVKGKILPYQQVRELLTKVNELLKGTDYAAMEDGISELKALIDSASDKATYHYEHNGVSFDSEIAFSSEDNSPVITLTFPDNLSELGLNSANSEAFQVSMSTICSSSVLNPQVEKMLSYVAMLFTDSLIGFSGEDGRFYLDKPECARCEVNENTYKFNILSPELKEVFSSGSETYINSDGEEVKRDSGDENPIDYVTILVSDPSTIDHAGETLADNLTWIVIL